MRDGGYGYDVVNKRCGVIMMSLPELPMTSPYVTHVFRFHSRKQETF